MPPNVWEIQPMIGKHFNLALEIAKIRWLKVSLLKSKSTLSIFLDMHIKVCGHLFEQNVQSAQDQCSLVSPSGNLSDHMKLTYQTEQCCWTMKSWTHSVDQQLTSMHVERQINISCTAAWPATLWSVIAMHRSTVTLSHCHIVTLIKGEENNGWLLVCWSACPRNICVCNGFRQPTRTRDRLGLVVIVVWINLPVCI